jgi:hypothetical protein
MKQLRLFSIFLAGSALMLSACAKDDDPSGTSATTASTSNGSGNETDPNETGETGTNTTFGGDGDGDGDGDPTTTTMGGFVPDEDFGGVSECDPWTQDCPMGEKCVAYGSTGGNWDANKCVAVTGDGAAGDTCTYGGVVEATDDCDANTHCWDVMDVDGQPIGVCTAFCTGTADNPMCEPGTSCLIANDGSINLCITNCDPLLQDCGSGLACFWANGNFNCIFTTQDIPLGEPCGFINDCIAGTGCLTAEVMPNCNGSACCGSFCDLGDPTCPQAGTECSAFFEEGMAPPGYESVGVCIIPGA